MLKVGRVACALIALWPVHALADETVTDLAQKFGARESVRSVSLSPQGDKAVAVFAQPENGETAAVIDFASEADYPLGRKGG